MLWVCCCGRASGGALTCSQVTPILNWTHLTTNSYFIKPEHTCYLFICIICLISVCCCAFIICVYCSLLYVLLRVFMCVILFWVQVKMFQSTSWHFRQKSETIQALKTCRCWWSGRNSDPDSPTPGRRKAWSDSYSQQLLATWIQGKITHQNICFNVSSNDPKITHYHSELQQLWVFVLLCVFRLCGP